METTYKMYGSFFLPFHYDVRKYPSLFFTDLRKIYNFSKQLLQKSIILDLFPQKSAVSRVVNSSFFKKLA